jgi:hypothetical protein
MIFTVLKQLINMSPLLKTPEYEKKKVHIPCMYIAYTVGLVFKSESMNVISIKAI